jgi:hypothetical protein
MKRIFAILLLTVSLQGIGQTLIDFYSESNYDNTRNCGSASQSYNSQTFYCTTAKTLSTCKFYVYKYNSPSGNVVAKIYSTNGVNHTPTTLLATSDIIEASTFPTSIALKEFTFSGSNAISLSNTTWYALVINYGGSGSIVVGEDRSSPTHGGMWWYSSDGTNWGANTGDDLIFYVYDSSSVVPSLFFSSPF